MTTTHVGREKAISVCTRAAYSAVVRVFAAYAFAAIAAAPAGAQQWRTLDVARSLADSQPLRATVVYGVGTLNVGSAPAPFLYHMRFRYDRAHTEPVHSYDAATRTLKLGIRSQSLASRGQHGTGDLRVELSPATPLDLSFEVGAAQATLELGGLSLTNLSLKSGASDATVRFSSPNRVAMRQMRLKTGAAHLEAVGLANANASEVHVDAGIGGVELDFGGTWTHDMTLDVNLILGGVEVRVPPEVGVRLRVRRLVGAFDDSGLVQRGEEYVTRNYDRAPYKLTVRALTRFGGFSLEHGPTRTGD